MSAPRFAVGPGHAWYRGPSGDGGAHAHAAFQIAIAVPESEEVRMVDAYGVHHRSAVLVVPPMVRHRLLPVTELLTFFVEPHCALADRLRTRCAGRITAAPDLRGLREEEVRRATGRPSGALDARLVAALDALAAGRPTMPELAASVGLSPQRLRALSRRQLGMPLPRWRIWQRLIGAAGALHEGRPPAEAAVAGGFADQAHFSRQLREMTGLTPSAVLPALRPPAASPAAGSGGPGQPRRAT
ncbi:AraC family transcriptional regulator [Streptomyces sp. NBC_00091]|uniref:helix-turn-helix domain-containing protein n=1 Tax=Streptomyces sp. NBC_00091 TaxID=2975648 RepID=UPI002251D4AA|nr:AraC family transcriptional regulator [Streptomyces sp. NBC_00091]MCX5379457.1 AraC family transcriptional regulator [Streptomyces sp. NBC_00091]